MGIAKKAGISYYLHLSHKPQALYPDGKLIVYTGQELMTKPPNLCQPTEAATV